MALFRSPDNLCQCCQNLMDLLKLLYQTDCRIYFGLPGPPHFLSDLNIIESDKTSCSSCSSCSLPPYLALLSGLPQALDCWTPRTGLRYQHRRSRYSDNSSSSTTSDSSSEYVYLLWVSSAISVRPVSPHYSPCPL